MSREYFVSRQGALPRLSSSHQLMGMSRPTRGVSRKRVTDPFWSSCVLSGVEHRHRHNHDIVHRYIVDLLFTSRLTRHLWRAPTSKPTATNSCFCPGPRQTCHHFRHRTTFVLKAIPKKRVNENEEAMWGEASILQDVGQPYMVYPFQAQPTRGWVGDILLSLM